MQHFHFEENPSGIRVSRRNQAGYFFFCNPYRFSGLLISHQVPEENEDTLLRL
jgi:hypothetical protein